MPPPPPSPCACVSRRRPEPRCTPWHCAARCESTRSAVLTRIRRPLICLGLFGPRRRWSDTVRPFLWTHTSAMVPGFTGDTEVSMPLALTYDLEVAAGKYLHAVRDGEIPLSLMFSGTVFYAGDNGFHVQQIPWDTDVRHLMPAGVWRQAMDRYFPGSGWIRLPQETLDTLLRLRAELGLTSWEETVGCLLYTSDA